MSWRSERGPGKCATPRCAPRLAVFGRFHPPHPNPLPWGEGGWRPALGDLERSALKGALPMILPLPKGEGWGEGEMRLRPVDHSRTASSAGSLRCLCRSLFSRGLPHWPTIVGQRMRRAFLKSIPNRVAYRPPFPAQARIPKAHHFNAARLEPGVTFGVFRQRLWKTMLKAVQFDIQFRFDAEKVEYMRPVRVLA